MNSLERLLYYPLGDAVMHDIIRLQLRRIEKRIRENHKVPFAYTDDVVKLVASRCTELESGGRMIDAILTNTILPKISQQFLTRTLEGKGASRVQIGTEGSDFTYAFD